MDGQFYSIIATIDENSNYLHLWINGEYLFYPLDLQDSYREPKYVLGGANLVVAPLPGLVTRVLVEEGEKLRRGQVVAILSSMKMEHHLLAETNGIVYKIFVTEGSQVSYGDPIVAIKK